MANILKNMNDIFNKKKLIKYTEDIGKGWRSM